MPEFTYVARDSKARTLRGEIEARDLTSAVRRMHDQDLTVLRMEPVRPKHWIFLLMQPVRPALIVLYLQQLAAMLAAGIPMGRSLDALAQEPEGPLRFRKALRRVADDVQSGYSLSQAMRLRPEFFSPFVVGSVRIGEVSGRLPETLANCAGHLEKEYLHGLRLRQAMVYPVVLLTCSGLLVALCFTYMVPRFVELFGDVQIELPWPTRVLLDTSRTVRRYGPVALATLAGPVAFAIWLLNRWVQTRPGRWHVEWLLLRVPWYGAQVRRRMLAGYFRSLATLLHSAIPLVVCLDVLVASLDREILSATARFQRAAVREGSSLSAGMRRSGFFPPLALELMRTGEETGNPVPMLERLADFFDEEMTRGLEWMSRLLEPLVLLGMGLSVAFLLLAAFLPIYRLAEAF